MGKVQAQVNAWFDVYSYEIETREEDYKGVSDGAAAVHEFIKAEQLKHPDVKFILAGWSQGSALASFSALTLPADIPIAGVMLVAGYVPFLRQFSPDPEVSRLTIFLNPRLLC